ncbi:phosphate acetyltransferase [Lacihabitans sp. LS3-19]|uniref:phosphate acetyltransferase n=1 Tax=Lacihabitans sp. LS3-19 TaxID=2487335 RepID=UPI0020CFB85E|nr:phosphate acetyltransferase [Lacihabitans sp. LS3-19]MCP9767518.1 phosphate acetyltransferase [Lacihabitans sp. LS3-19]
MTKGIYIATVEDHSGKSLISLGLMHKLLGKMPKVGFFRPIIEDGELDTHTQMMLSHFDLKISYEQAIGITRSTAVHMINQGKTGEIIDLLIDKYKQLEEQSDFVLVEGTDFKSEGGLAELNINVLIAKNFGLPVILIGNGIEKTKEELQDIMQMAYNSYEEKDVQVIAIINNKILLENIEIANMAMKDFLPADIEAYAIPRIGSLLNPTMREIIADLDGKILFGADYLENQVGSMGVGAMQLRNYLPQVKEDNLVITPGDRADIILGVLQANISKNYPQIAGIILTGGLVPEEPIIKLIEGLSFIVPIVSVEEGTFQIANKVGALKSKIYANSHKKIQTSIEIFEENVPIGPLLEKLMSFENLSLTPRMFQYSLIKKAKISKKHIVLPEGTDERIIIAAARLVSANLVDITLLGEEYKIKEKVISLGLNLDYEKINIVNPIESKHFEDYVKTIFELRKHKNINMDIARDYMLDVSYFGTMMIYKGHADGMVSGATHTTQHTIRPALQFIKTKPGINLVSSVFFMCLEDRVVVFGDCAINPNPTAFELAEIAISSAESALAFGIEPKIAMLSYSSGSSGKGTEVEKVREATEIVKIKRPDLKIEGPIQYDAAVDMEIGQSKMPNSEVAGQASVLIFPDLNTGNNTYKAVQRETGAIAIGPMLQGLNKPVNDLSRGCTVDDVYNTVIITAIQAQGI